MPLLKIETNVPSSKIPDRDALLKDLSQVFTKVIGKPENYIMVHLVPDQALIFGGSTDPCANCYVMSIGKLGPEENKAHAAALYPVINKHLGIPEDRMYMAFHDSPTHELAFKSTTFQQILGK